MPELVRVPFQTGKCTRCGKEEAEEATEALEDANTDSFIVQSLT